MRAVTVRFATRVQGEEAGRAALEEELGRGFVHVPALLEGLMRYESDRQRCPRLADFLPELLLPLVESAARAAADPAKRPPLIVSSTPPSGATGVDPELGEIGLDFDLDMDPRGYGFLRDSSRAFPETAGEPRWETARRCLLPVRLAPATEYWIGINLGGVAGFRGTNGIAAGAFELRFSTR